MLEITIKNCYKCDLETIINNDSQYFWINLRDFEAEAERNWQNIFNKYSNSSTLKHRKELSPNIQFQPDRIFVRNDLFERIIKSCKATNVEFLMLKEKLGLCSYEVICDEQKFILMPEIQDDIKEFKKENEESIKIKISEEPTGIKNSKEPKEIKSPKEDENTTDWYDKIKFKKILDVVCSNKLNHKNKIGKFKYNDIKNLVNNINKNTISETLAKENINALKELKNTEIKKKRLISNQKELLNLFDDLLEAIFNNNNKNNNNDNNNNNNNNNNNESENESESESDRYSENENDNKNDNQSRKKRKINYCFKTIDELKSLEEQINLLKEINYLDDFWYMSYYDDDKELNLKIFKLKVTYLSKEIDQNLFVEVFGHTFVTLAKN